MARINYIARRAARIRAEQRPANVLAAFLFALSTAGFGTLAVNVIIEAPQSYAPAGELAAAIMFVLIITAASMAGVVWAAWNARP